MGNQFQLREKLDLKKFREVMRVLHLSPLRRAIMFVLKDAQKPLTVPEIVNKIKERFESEGELRGGILKVDNASTKRDLEILHRGQYLNRYPKGANKKKIQTTYELNRNYVIDSMNISINELLEFTQGIHMNCRASPTVHFFYRNLLNPIRI